MKKVGEFSGIKIYSLASNEMVVNDFTAEAFAHLMSTIFPMTKEAAPDIAESARHSLQQLKAEIATCLNGVIVPERSLNHYMITVADYEKLRQLSAI